MSRHEECIPFRLIEESPTDYTIRCALPDGLEEGCLQVDLDEGFISISVERPWSGLLDGDSGEGWADSRCPVRRIALPPGTDHSRARFSFRDNEIEILVPKGGMADADEAA